MWQEQEFLLPADHPSAPGHFPGNPVIPGALLLDAVLAAIAPGQAGITISGAKFLAPARHGTALTLRWQNADSKIRFECRAAGTLVMSGTLSRCGAP
jgi:3-hydroxymyristoyl/3-hydroxydecanoyl-(acyl carrier protein) dehydratase